MADMFLHGKPIESVFQLLGDHENDVTYSVGWALANSPAFLQAFVDTVVAPGLELSNVVLRLQEYEGRQGITDIEIESAGSFHVIVEAKRGWTLPTLTQLEKYAERPTFMAHQVLVRRLVALSECSREYALIHLPAGHIGDVPVVPLSWREVAGIAAKARTTGTHAERRLLDELDLYLRGLMTMQNVNSNWVYVVSLSRAQATGWGCTWLDIVTVHGHYTHEIGGKAGWPKEPPNYLAFRYDGHLQSIHHVEAYEVVTSLVGKVPMVQNDGWNPKGVPQFFYTLGPAFKPSEAVPTGNIYPSGRVWCMLDTLFTARTIAEARDISNARAARAGERSRQA